MRKILIVCLAMMIITQPVLAGGNVVDALIVDRSIYNKLGYDISNDLDSWGRTFFVNFPWTVGDVHFLSTSLDSWGRTFVL